MLFIKRLYCIVFLCMLSMPALPDELSENIFPDTLDGLPLYQLEKADIETAFGFLLPIEKGYKAIYKIKGKYIFVNILLGKNENAVTRKVHTYIEESKSITRAQYGDAVRFKPTVYDPFKGLNCSTASYIIEDPQVPMNGRLLVLGEGKYLITVHIMSAIDTPTLEAIQNIAERFYNKLHVPTKEKETQFRDEAAQQEDQTDLLCKICHYGGEMRTYANCIVSIVSEYFTILETVEFVQDFSCDVIPKIIEALRLLDLKDEKSIAESKKLFNEATGKLIVMFVDLANWFKKVQLLLEFFECFDDMYGFSGKSLDLIMESLSRSLYRIRGYSSHVVVAHSPVNVMIQTKEGLCGMDKNGNMHNELEGAFYKHFKNQDTTLILFLNKKVTSNIEVIASATGWGTVNLTWIHTQEDGSQVYQEYNSIKINPHTVINFNPYPWNEVFVDNDGDGEYNRRKGDVVLKEPHVRRKSEIKYEDPVEKIVILFIVALCVFIVCYVVYKIWKKDDKAANEQKRFTIKKIVILGVMSCIILLSTSLVLFNIVDVSMLFGNDTSDSKMKKVPGDSMSLADVSKDYSVYEYSRLDHECESIIQTILSYKIGFRCNTNKGMWRAFWVKAFDVSNSFKNIRIKANLELKDHLRLFRECSGRGVKYPDYVCLYVLSKDPREVFEKECNKVCSETEWSQCSIRPDNPDVLAFCGVPRCRESHTCYMDVDITGYRNIYLVFAVNDAWAFADVEGSMSDLEIGSFKK
jgi:hypothetical protein